MADEATRAVGVPNGLPVGWIAPESAILDRGDLETMRDGLRAGKTVAIASDGHVYVSGEATGQPMTPEAQQFIESRLGVVKQLVDMSGGMTIHPDGRMFGTFANQSIKVAMGPDPSLDQDELNLVHAGIASGANVAVLPDGSVQYQLQPGTQPPSAEEAQQRMAYFDEEVNSGRVGVALSAGHAVRMSGDVYQTMPPPATPNGMQFPRPGDPEPAVPPTSPLPGATPEGTVGPQLADTTPAPEQTTPGATAVGDTPAATATADVTGSDGAAVAYDDGGIAPAAVDSGDATANDGLALADGQTDDGTVYDAGGYGGVGDDGAGYDSSPTGSVDDAYASAGDSYATSGDASASAYDGTAYDSGGAYDDAAYATTDGSGSDSASYDGGGDSGGDSYSYAAADTSGYDGGGLDASGDAGGGDAYSYATVDSSGDDGSGYDTSGYDDSGDAG